MGFERFAWMGNIMMSGVGIYLSYRPIAHELGKVTVTVLAGLLILAAFLMFPGRRRQDGSSARLFDSFRASVRGSRNAVQIARDHANQTMYVDRHEEDMKRDE